MLPRSSSLFSLVLVAFAIRDNIITSEAWTPNNNINNNHNKISAATILNMAGHTETTSTSGTKNPLPNLPIPNPICSTEPGTWAYDTMSRRVDEEILQRTYEDIQDDLESPAFATIKKRFEELRGDLQFAATRQLTYLDEPSDNANSDERQKEWNEWKQILEPFISQQDTWLSAPWMVTEFYVYRRLMAAIGYWEPDTAGYRYDPFLKQKRAGLQSSVGSAEPMLAKIPALPRDSEGIQLAASIALWGNKMDLSLWPADMDNAKVDMFSQVLATASENLLHDDSDVLAAHCDKLRQTGGGNVDIIVDNAGFELVTDLALAQYLVQSGIAKCVTFQLKSHPTFVSDALEKDLLETVEHYANLNADEFPHAQAAGATWKEFLDKGQWKCVEDNFWVQAFAMWDMTEPLRSDMVERCDLAFVKGDANYRRLLGDCMWDYTAPFADVVGCYFPCPVCALRTLKAEIGCGMDADQVARAKELDDNWMVNGRFGVVHFGKGAGR
ncbi:glutamate O-methyltransferase [Seminavis robusta]|uniref:Sugar phosphate phosphatase n=1 Tax=Seminavis robusta TaxID=568900 RepID=A0A9N8EU61_9STRA|nr:glutamate O-methyltransferase [Seminavis robusta]|eukprot:Sro1959_g307970.1 glutamate O-methyltransferase (498) ;mRNA; f:12256-13749